MSKLTVTHEAPLELIKQHPALAVDLLKAVTGTPLRAGLDVRLASTSLNTVTPGQYTADTVVLVSDPDTREALAAIIVEPQGRDEQTKKFAWPAYLANARREIGCESAYLIVVCPDPAEAEDCRTVIPLGHGLELSPIVIDPKHAPSAEDAGPYLLLFLACLPTLDMEDPAVAHRVLAAIRDTRASYADRKTLAAIILLRASGAARHLLEEMMQSLEWKSEFIESYEEHGLARGLEQGLEQGVEQGRVVKAREDLIKALDIRRLRPTGAQRIEVGACNNLAQLDLWFERSLTAITAADVFKN